MITDVPLFRFKRGGHICVFYYDETSLLEFLVPYICEGIRLGEKCFLVQPRSIMERLPFALSIAGVSLPSEAARKSIELYSTEDVYLKDGGFDVDSMMSHLEDSITSAVSEGFNGLRTAGDLGWAAAVNLPHDTLLLYEKMVHQSFPNQPAVGVCQYPVQVFPAKLLEEVLQLHQASLQQPRLDSGRACLSIQKDSYTLDVVADRLRPESTVYYVVQELGSKNIVGFGAEATVENAIRMGQELIQAS